MASCGLTGSIPSGAQRLEAAVAVRAVPGISAVKNDLHFTAAKN
jgi:osmotically-inducible protein OsmY